MKVKIITLHSIYNPGSVFQAFGLQEFLRSNKFDAQIIDYRPGYSTIGKNKIKGLLRKLLFYRTESSIKKKYEEFIQQRMFLTDKRYRTHNDLQLQTPIADIYMTGSDQLWNMDYDCGRDDVYYLGFVENGKKIAYSTSIGKRNIPQEELNTISSKISDFSVLAVREKSTSELLSEVLQRDVHWVCDPVFLLSSKIYEEMSPRIVKEKYVVVYLSAESTLLDNVIKYVKEKTDFNVILLGGNRTRCQCDKHVKDLGPYEFLSYLRHAELIVSSSFHATAFSHIFHKKFVAILPKTNGERIESLLELSELTERIICTEENIPVMFNEIDFDLVDKKLENFIEKSKELLLQSLM